MISIHTPSRLNRTILGGEREGCKKKNLSSSRKKLKCSMWGLNPRSSRLKRLWYSQVQKSELAYKHDAITSQLMERKIWQLRQTPNSWYEIRLRTMQWFYFSPLRRINFQGAFTKKLSKPLFIASARTLLELKTSRSCSNLYELQFTATLNYCMVRKCSVQQQKLI